MGWCLESYARGCGVLQHLTFIDLSYVVCAAVTRPIARGGDEGGHAGKCAYVSARVTPVTNAVARACQETAREKQGRVGTQPQHGGAEKHAKVQIWRHYSSGSGRREGDAIVCRFSQKYSLREHGRLASYVTCTHVSRSTVDIEHSK